MSIIFILKSMQKSKHSTVIYNLLINDHKKGNEKNKKLNY